MNSEGEIMADCISERSSLTKAESDPPGEQHFNSADTGGNFYLMLSSSYMLGWQCVVSVCSPCVFF